MDILELLRTRLDAPLLEKLGAALGLDAVQAQTIGQAVVPAQMAVLRQQAGTQAGAQRVLDLVAQVPGEAAQAQLDTPEGINQVRQIGTALLPQLLGNRLDDVVGEVAGQTGSGRSSVLGMMQMVLPLVLGVLGQQVGSLGLNAGSLESLFSRAPGGVGEAEANMPGSGGAAAGLSAAVIATGAAGLKNTTALPGAGAAAPVAAAGPVSTQGKATVGEGAGLGGGVLHSNPALGGSRGLGLLWLLPIVLLLLLGGCFLVAGKPAAPFAVISPANASTVTGAFMVKGTGTAGHEVTVSEKGQPVGKTTVGEDGLFNVDMAAPSAGVHTYALAEEGSDEALSLAVTGVAAGTAAAGDSMKKSNMNGEFSVTAPATGVDLPAGAFDLNGTGRAGEVIEIFEDGVSLGKVTVGADGTWSMNVPSPAAGAHVYTFKGSDGTELGSFRTTIAAATSGASACTKTFSLSIPDSQTVAQPFRFGGVGSGKSYTVTVTRGAHRIGSKVLTLDGTCGYSYTSKPGKGTITYSVTPTGSAVVAGKITLTVQ